MLLANPADILSDLGFDSMTDITSAVTEALNAVEPMMSARLDTDFSTGTFTDMFYVRTPPYQEGHEGTYRHLSRLIIAGTPSGVVTTKFRLRRGFVQSIDSIKYASSILALASIPPAICLKAVVVPTYNDLERGVLSDYQTFYSNNFVSVTYKAGFPTASDTNPPTSYDLTKVPRWLQEAAKIRAKIQLAGSPALEEANIKLDTKTLNCEFNALIGRRVRYAPSALLPM